MHELPKRPLDVIEDSLDVKEVRLRRGNQYERFSVKWMRKPAGENTWFAEVELRKTNPAIYAEIAKVFLLEPSFSLLGGTDTKAFKNYVKTKPP